MDGRWIVQLGGADDLGNGKGLQAALPPQSDRQALAALVVEPKQRDGWRQFRKAITALSMLSLI
jgi:hypothetical protein